ncbi:MAG: hypothetical protein RL664_1474, partial [Bacteroidota bacterium]
MQQLQNFALGQWISGSGKGTELFDAVNGELVAVADSSGLDFGAMLNFGRETGGPALRKMTFQERGRMLKALALYLTERKAAYYAVSVKTGATKIDSWIDIDGGIGNLFAYASLRKQFPDSSFYVDGELAKLSKEGTFIGHHIMVPKEGVALHINAFNFPVWGMLEKIAVNLLAGVPAVVKPATLTSYLTEVVVRDIHASGILPEGALQLICGSANGIFDHLEMQDVVTFTGSASTGKMLKSHPRLVDQAIPFTMEADSLNAAILGLDAAPGTEEFDLFVKEVRKEITVKCGQKCTAVRRILVPGRILVPEKYLSDVQEALVKALGQTAIGDPRNEKVRMGSLAGMAQREDVLAALNELKKESDVLFGNDALNLIEAEDSKGAFMSPTLLLNDKPFEKLSSHNIEAFGPISTIMPYSTTEEAVAISKLGKGSLVCSITTNDTTIARDFVVNAASHHGRILVPEKYLSDVQEALVKALGQTAIGDPRNEK